MRVVFIISWEATPRQVGAVGRSAITPDGGPRSRHGGECGARQRMIVIRPEAISAIRPKMCRSRTGRRSAAASEDGRRVLPSGSVATASWLR
jgi:hypothetical protein